MVRAFSGVGVFRVTLQKKMSCLRVHQPVHERPVTVDAHANAGADGNIDCRVAVFCGSPGNFAKHRRIHVRIKSDRDAERPCKSSHHIDILPFQLRRAGNISIGRGRTVQIHRSETPDSE